MCTTDYSKRSGGTHRPLFKGAEWSRNMSMSFSGDRGIIDGEQAAQTPMRTSYVVYMHVSFVFFPTHLIVNNDVWCLICDKKFYISNKSYIIRHRCHRPEISGRTRQFPEYLYHHRPSVD